MPIGRAPALLRRRRTKIVATVGPASDSSEMLERLMDAGVDVFRLNFSHGDHESHRATYERIRSLAARRGDHTAILADLCGPKIRVGRFPGGSIELVAGQPLLVTTRDVMGAAGLVPSQYEALSQDVGVGDRILLDDGGMEIAVEAVDGSEIACRVVRGGLLRDRKGMNLPGVRVSAPSLTEKDHDDARFALALGVDFLALSFVRQASDIEGLTRLISSCGGQAGIIAKIETPGALEDIEGILGAADGIMVARGDLGVELPPEEVPLIQDQLVELARTRGKPVIIATQMLESMVSRGRPTRAEVSDIAHAVMSGADAVMLSAETTSGAYPVEAVCMMDRVARQTEGRQWNDDAFGSILDGNSRLAPPLSVEVAVGRATSRLSRELRVRAILIVSATGTTARVLSSGRPAAPVAGLSKSLATCRRMTLLWGVVPLLVEEADLEKPLDMSREVSKKLGLADDGQPMLMVRGFHDDPSKSTPSITVLTV